MIKPLARAVRKLIRRTFSPRQMIDFRKFRLTVDMRDRGGEMYSDPGYFSDLECPIARDIVRLTRPSVFIDVGANYGFTALAHSAINPEAKIIAIEPSPKLVPLLTKNLRDNGVKSFSVVAAICSDRPGDMSFHLNPNGSQDNRVIGGERWKSVQVPAVTLDQVLAQLDSKDFVFIKIDTQGFEKQVLAGGDRWLRQSSNWLVKTEFAPAWLRSQGTDPGDFLQSLMDHFQVAELPRRARFKGDNLHEVMKNRLSDMDAREFTRYVESMADGKGWCDLLVAPGNASY